jgi:hypothetical protein
MLHIIQYFLYNAHTIQLVTHIEYALYTSEQIRFSAYKHQFGSVKKYNIHVGTSYYMLLYTVPKAGQILG